MQRKRPWRPQRHEHHTEPLRSRRWCHRPDQDLVMDHSWSHSDVCKKVTESLRPFTQADKGYDHIITALGKTKVSLIYY